LSSARKLIDCRTLFTPGASPELIVIDLAAAMRTPTILHVPRHIFSCGKPAATLEVC
jgi:hypothetical protein